MKRKLVGLTMAACSVLGLAAGTDIATAPSALAANACDAVKDPNSYTASVRCAGPAQFVSFQFVINCYDGISDTRYSIASAWLPRGSTAKLSCGAPQRQYIASTYANFRY